MIDYKNVPDKYVPGRPLLKWDTLKKIPVGVKRLHDWYMMWQNFLINMAHMYLLSS
jgi:hypothetical protein